MKEYLNNDIGLDWDDVIENDGKEFIVLSEGDYNFTITDFERGRTKGSDKMKPCNMAILTLRVDSDKGTAFIRTQIVLNRKCEYRISSFFRCIDRKRQGERGRAHFKPGTYTDNDGKSREKTDVSYFIDYNPNRGDMKNLGEFFDSKAYEYSMIQAICDGYLCPIKAQMIPLELDIKNVGISNGDYSAGDIGHALEPYLHQIAAEMKKCCQGRKTVVFLPLIAISQKFCKILNEIGFKAAEVNGSSDDRAEVLFDFENGKYDVLCNSMLLTEGWDCPSVDCIVVLRPTKNRSLYQQIVGRGLRLYPGKEHLLLLDFLWLTTRHDLCKPSSLISKNDEIAQKIDKQIEDTGEFDLIEAEENAERDVLAEREEALAEELRKLRTRKKQFVDPLQYALSIATEDLATYTPIFDWEMKPPAKAQLSMISSRGVDTDCVTCAGYASMLIDKLIRRQEAGLSTPKQIRLLEKYGFREVGTWEFSQASNMISMLARHNWRLPNGLIKKWFTSEILPTVRAKTEGVSLENLLDNPEFIIAVLKKLQSEMDSKKAAEDEKSALISENAALKIENAKIKRQSEIAA